MLEDEELREKEGREIEILSLATERFKEKLSQLHNYQDNTVDRPFLLPEVVEKEKS